MRMRGEVISMKTYVITVEWEVESDSKEGAITELFKVMDELVISRDIVEVVELSGYKTWHP
jgi:hypothetical protein